MRVNACGGVLVLTQRITARAIQKFTHCALNTNPISKFPILPPPSSCPSSLKKLLSSFSLRFKFQDFRLWSCCIQATLVSKNFDRIWDIFATCSIYYETLVGFCKSLQKFFDSFLCLLLSPKFLSSFDFYQFYWIEFWTRFKISYHFFEKVFYLEKFCKRINSLN